MTTKKIDKERIAIGEKFARGTSNVMGSDGYSYNEPFIAHTTVLITDLWKDTPNTDSNFATPKYDDTPIEGSVGTRHAQVRLYPYLPSAVSDFQSPQTFIAVSSTPASNAWEDIEAVRIKNIIPSTFSVGRSHADEADGYYRGFELALFPAKSDGGVGNALVADTDNGPIPTSADPGAGSPGDIEEGAGDDGFWYVDYPNGVVRFSRPPLHGSGGLFNPNDVYGDVNGDEVAADGYGTITMFATFYQYTGRTGTNDNEQFITIGDGVISTGVFVGDNQNTFQAALNILDGYGGGTLFVKEGNYTFTGAVEVEDNTNIVGLNGANITRTTNDPAFAILGKEVTIEGLTIIPSGAQRSANIELVGNTNYGVVQDISIKNNILHATLDAYGVGFAPGVSGVTFKDIDISHNIAKGAQGAQTIIAVGVTGPTLLRTVDGGDSWSVAATLSQNVNYISSDGEVFIAACNNGLVAHSSDDGVTWTEQTLTGKDFYVVEKINGIWHLGGQNGTLWSSYDGTNWADHELEAILSHIRGIVEIDSRLIVFGPNEYNVSNNGGNSWELDPNVSPYSSTITCAGAAYSTTSGVLVVVDTSGGDGIYYTTDTLGAGFPGFNLAQSVSNPRRIEEHNGAFVVLADTGSIYKSQGGITWENLEPTIVTQHPEMASGSNYKDVKYSETNGWLIMVDDGSICYILQSDDLKIWNLTTFSEAGAFVNVFQPGSAASIFITDIVTGNDGYIDSLRVVGNSLKSGVRDSVLFSGSAIKTINDFTFSDNSSTGDHNVSISIPSSNFKSSQNLVISNNDRIGDLTLGDFSRLHLSKCEVLGSTTLSTSDGYFDISDCSLDGYFNITGPFQKGKFENNKFDKFNVTGDLNNTLFYNNVFENEVWFDGYLNDISLDKNIFHNVVSSSKDPYALDYVHNSISQPSFAVHETGVNRLQMTGNTIKERFYLFGEVTNSRIDNNVVGGLIIVANLKNGTTFSDSSLSNNVFDSSIGDPIFSGVNGFGIRQSSPDSSSANIIINRSSISFNKGSSAIFGIVDLSSTGGIAAKNSTIVGNTLGSNGITIANNDATQYTISGCTIGNNCAPSGNISNSSGYEAGLNSSINDNVFSGTLTVGFLRNCSFISNSMDTLSTSPSTDDFCIGTAMFGNSITNAPGIIQSHTAHIPDGYITSDSASPLTLTAGAVNIYADGTEVGNVNIRAGDSGGVSTGGGVNIVGGTGAAGVAGGVVDIAGGPSGGASGDGGYVYIHGADGDTSGGDGGRVDIVAGDGLGNAGGRLFFVAGDGRNQGGNVDLFAGDATNTGNGGSLDLYAGDSAGSNRGGGDVRISAGDSTGTGSSDVTIYAVDAGSVSGSGSNAEEEYLKCNGLSKTVDISRPTTITASSGYTASGLTIDTVSGGGSSLNLAPIQEPGSTSDGDLWVDNNTKLLRSPDGYYVAQKYADFRADDTVTSVTGVAHQNKYTIPANTLTAGSIIRVQASGYKSGASGVAEVTVRLDGGIIFTFSGVLANSPGQWVIDAKIFIINENTTSNVAGCATFIGSDLFADYSKSDNFGVVPGSRDFTSDVEIRIYSQMTSGDTMYLSHLTVDIT